MGPWEVLRHLSAAAILIGLILVVTGTVYFGSPPPPVSTPAGSSHGSCYPINGGLNVECDAYISIDTGFSVSIGGSIAHASQIALGQLIRSIGEFLDLVGFVGVLVEWLAKTEASVLPLMSRGHFLAIRG